MKMTTPQVVETSVTVNNSPNQDYVHLDDHTQPTYEMVTSVGNQLRFHNQSEKKDPSTFFSFNFYYRAVSEYPSIEGLRIQYIAPESCEINCS